MRTSLLLCFMISGCAGLSAGGKRVRLAEAPSALTSCTYVGEVAAESDNGHRAAFNALRNRASEDGANAVIIVTHAAGWGGARVEALAYVCPSDRAVVQSTDSCGWNLGCTDKYCFARQEAACYLRRLWS